MQLSILMPALTYRRKLREPLVASLTRQMQGRSDVELLIEEDDGTIPSGTKRNRLIQRSTGQYFAFVDDDDLVADGYVRRILKATLVGSDVVTFRLLRIADDRRNEVHDFSIHHQKDRRRGRGFIAYRANHLCAWRRDIGSAVSWQPNLGYKDDVFWYTPLLASGLPKAEYHIADVLYTYRWRREGTGNQSEASQGNTHKWAMGGVDYFWCDGGIVAATTGRAHRLPGPTIEVRDKDCRTWMTDRDTLTLFCTVKSRR